MNKTILVVLSALVIYCGLQINPTQSAQADYRIMEASGEVSKSTSASQPPNCRQPEICLSLLKAGFKEDQLQLMLAISEAESHFRLDAIGDVSLQNKTWGVSVGILQIRTLKTQNKGCRDYDKLMGDLDAQTSCAYQIWQTQDYNAWSAYLNGSYKQFM